MQSLFLPIPSLALLLAPTENSETVPLVLKPLLTLLTSLNLKSRGAVWVTVTRILGPG